MNWRQRFAAIQFSGEDRAQDYLKIAAYLENRKSLVETVDELYKRAARKGPTHPRAIIYDETSRGIRSGAGLGQSMSLYISPMERLLIESGEQSGHAIEALRLTANMLTYMKQMRSAVRKAIAYPSFLLVAACFYLAFVGIFLVPKFAALYNPMKWHGAGRILYLLGAFFHSPYVPVPFIAAALLAGGIYYTLPRWTGSVRTFFDRFPPWSLYRLFVGSSWMLALASLLKAEVPMISAIKQIMGLGENQEVEDLDEVDNPATPYLQERLVSMLRYLQSGKTIGVALEESGYNFPAPDLIDDIIFYADLPRFDDVLYKTAREFIESGSTRVNAISKVMNIGGIIAIGLSIMTMVFGLLSIYEQSVSHIHGM